MRISLKLASSFAVMALLVGVAGYWSSMVQGQVERELERLSRSAILNLVDAADMSDALSSAHRITYETLQKLRLETPTASRDEHVRRLVRHRRDEIETHLDGFQRSLERSQQARQALIQDGALVPATSESGEKTQADLARLAQDYDEYRALTVELLAGIEEDSLAATALFEERLDPSYHDQLVPLIDTVRQEAEADFSRGVRSAERSIGRAKARRNVITLVSLAIAVVLGLLVAWSIGRPLTTLTHATSQIAAGRLDTRVDLRSYDEVGALAQSFNNMAASLQSKTVAKSYVDNIIGSLRDMLLVTDGGLKIRTVNSAAIRELGFSADELVGVHLSRVFDEPLDDAAQAAGLPTGWWGTRELRLKTKAGSSVPVSCSISPLADDSGKTQGMVCVATDITERQAAEQKILASLREKEVLLKEVHHRVKNNLQIVSSLLNLQAGAAETPGVARAMRESQGRIHSMSLIHEQLYQSDNLANIDFAEYVRELTNHLARSTGAAARGVVVQVKVETGPLPIDVAIPCGMIVNELVTNAMEHAFPRREGGVIRVGFRNVNGESELNVNDDGVGFSEPDGGAVASTSLGLKVVHALTDQIGGTMQCDTTAGTRFNIRFETKKDPGQEAAHD